MLAGGRPIDAVAPPRVLAGSQPPGFRGTMHAQQEERAINTNTLREPEQGPAPPGASAAVPMPAALPPPRPGSAGSAGAPWQEAPWLGTGAQRKQQLQQQEPEHSREPVAAAGPPGSGPRSLLGSLLGGGAFRSPRITPEPSPRALPDRMGSPQQEGAEGQEEGWTAEGAGVLLGRSGEPLLLPPQRARSVRVPRERPQPPGPQQHPLGAEGSEEGAAGNGLVGVQAPSPESSAEGLIPSYHAAGAQLYLLPQWLAHARGSVPCLIQAASQPERCTSFGPASWCTQWWLKLPGTLALLFQAWHGPRLRCASGFRHQTPAGASVSGLPWCTASAGVLAAQAVRPRAQASSLYMFTAAQATVPLSWPGTSQCVPPAGPSSAALNEKGALQRALSKKGVGSQAKPAEGEAEEEARRKKKRRRLLGLLCCLLLLLLLGGGIGVVLAREWGMAGVPGAWQPESFKRGAPGTPHDVWLGDSVRSSCTSATPAAPLPMRLHAEPCCAALCWVCAVLKKKHGSDAPAPASAATYLPPSASEAPLYDGGRPWTPQPTLSGGSMAGAWGRLERLWLSIPSQHHLLAFFSSSG